MPSLGALTKYLGLFSLGKDFIDKVVLERILIGAAKVLALSVVAAMLAGAIVIGLLSILYSVLIDYTSINEVGALVIVGVIVIALITFLVYQIIKYSKKVASFSSLLMQHSLPKSPVSDIVNAFISGLKEPAGAEPAPKGKKYPKSVK